jgi:hypothetical protein
MSSCLPAIFRAALVSYAVSVLGLVCSSAIAASEQTEVSIKVGREEALSVISKYKMEKEVVRIDRYFDFFKDGRFQLSKETAPFKIRLMSNEEKTTRLQTSEVVRGSDFNCDGLDLQTKTKKVYESKPKENDFRMSEDDLESLNQLHVTMLDNLGQLEKEAYQLNKNDLAESYRNLNFKLKDRLKSLGIRDGFVASYASSKRKFKADLLEAGGQKIELSVTLSRNYCSKTCIEDDYTLEFQKSDNSSDLFFAEGVCSIVKGLNLKDIRPSSEVNPTLAESLKNHIRLN